MDKDTPNDFESINLRKRSGDLIVSDRACVPTNSDSPEDYNTLHRRHKSDSQSTQSKSQSTVEAIDDRKPSAKTIVWFQLVDNYGNPYKGTNASKVEITSSVNVAKFRRDVQNKYFDSHLKGVASSDLCVFRDKDAFDKRNVTDEKEEPLKSSHSIDGMGRIVDEALYVVVPASSYVISDTKHLQPEERRLVFDLNSIVDIQTLKKGSCFQITGLNIAGLSPPKISEKTFYCRQDTIDLIEKLQNMGKGIVINGPPGVGKSKTVWFWVCNQVKYDTNTKSALWIQLGLTIRMVRLKRSGFTKFITKNLTDDQIITLIKNASDAIVVVDGVTSDSHHQKYELALFHNAQDSDHRIVSVSSMAGTRKTEDLKICETETYVADPWSLDEYYEAIRINTFFESVREKLVRDDDVANPRAKLYKRDLVDRKFFYAGFNARWMFEMTFTEIIKDINLCVDGAKDYVGLIKGNYGDQTDTTNNYLTVKPSNKEYRVFTSQYICNELVRLGGDSVLLASYAIAQTSRNPSLRGWVLELDFINQIKKAQAGNKILQVTSNDISQTIVKLEISRWFKCNTNAFEEIKEITDQVPTIEALHDAWFLPTKWNQAGYDLVCLHRFKLDRTRTFQNVLRFIQVTGGKVHGLKLIHFANFATNFSRATGESIVGIEIYIAIPNTQRNFSIPAARVSGDISTWNVGESNIKWSTPESQVKIVKFQPSQELL